MNRKFTKLMAALALLTFLIPITGWGQTRTNVTVFEETFNQCNGTGGYDSNGNFTNGNPSATLTADNTGWTFANGSGANKCAKFGTSSNKGSAQTPSISLDGDATLTFKAAAWDASTEGTTLNLSATSGTLKINGQTVSSVTLTKGAWNT